MTVGSLDPQQKSSPVPRRNRLSLKNNKKKNTEDEQRHEVVAPPPSPPQTAPPEPVEEDVGVTACPVSIPVVASFRNLGNTCFLNSVLQVLRYTPGFVEQVSYLSKEVLSAHREKLAGNSTEDSDVEVSPPWRLVRSLSKIYVRMNKEEDSFEYDSDPCDLVVSPGKLLDIVREMNPMFEGNLQHDAQEILRCLQCYIQDATNELTKYRTESTEGSTEPTDDLTNGEAIVPQGILNGEVDMSQDCNFNYDLKHLTPTKPEIKMKGGARAKTTTAKQIKVKAEKDSNAKTSPKKSKCNSTSQRGKGSKKCVKAVNSPKKKSKSRMTLKSHAKDSDVESRPVSENVLENLGEQKDVSVSVDKEGSVTLSPCKNTSVTVSSRKDCVGLKKVTKSPVKCELNGVNGDCLVNGSHSPLNGDSAVPECLPKFSSCTACKKVTAEDRVGAPTKNSVCEEDNLSKTANTCGGSRTLENLAPVSHEKVQNCSPEVIQRVRKSPKKSRSFADVFSSFVTQKVSTSGEKKDAIGSPENVSKFSPITCQISPNESIKIPNTSNPVLPDSLSPTVRLVSLENEHLEVPSRKVNLISKFESTVDGAGDRKVGLKVQKSEPLEPLEVDVTFGKELDAKVLNGALQNTPVKLPNGVNTKLPATCSLSPTVDLYAVDRKTSPLKTEMCSPIKNGASRKIDLSKSESESQAECQNMSESKIVELTNDTNWSNTMDATTSEDLPGLSTPVNKNLTRSPQQGKTPPEIMLDCAGDRLESLPQKDAHSNKRSISDLDVEFLPNPAKRARRASGDCKQTNLFSLFGKKGPVRRLGMRGGVVRKDEEIPTVLPSSEQTISNGASGLLAEELESENAKPASNFDTVDYNCDLISPMRELKKDKYVTPIKSFEAEHFDLFKARKSLDFQAVSADLDTGAVVDICDRVKTESEPVQTESEIPELEVLETIRMEDLVKDALDSTKQAVVCLEKCDALISRKKIRQIDSNYDQDKVKVVENLFQGSVVLKTRCLECECCTARKEDFQDVSVPIPSRENKTDDEQPSQERKDSDVLSDDEDFPDINSDDWMLSAMDEVEQLRDDNKYYCDKCCRLVEAQRFMQYETVPDILTFHIKRFAHCSSLFGGVSKLTDHAATPFSLPCFRASCPKPCLDTSHSYDLYGIIMHSGQTITAGHYTAYVKVPSSVTSMNKKVQENDDHPALYHLSDLAGHWLDCDDDTIQVLTPEDLMIALSEPDTCATPYVLFYQRSG